MSASFVVSGDPFDKPPCRGCSSYLTEPYIKCAECGPASFSLCLQVHAPVLLKSPFISKLLSLTNTILCFQCFTKGFEYKKHKSDHRYEIMVRDLSVMFYQSVSNNTFILSFFSIKTDLEFPCAGVWMDGAGRDGFIGGGYGLWLWKLVSDLKYRFLSLVSWLRK